MLTYNLENRNKESKYHRLYSLIKKDILSGNIKSGERLPSRRTLADHLNVSVITVDSAYRQLIDEGYVISHERSGFFVCSIDGKRHESEEKPCLQLLEETPPMFERNSQDTGFRYSALTKIMREVITDYGERLLEKPQSYGCPELRNAIAEYLLRYRGMLAQPERIIIGSGSEYLYGLVIQFFGRNHIYGLENPSYEKIRRVYEANGARCEMLSMDEDGISSEALRKTSADILHITPFHSYPSGISASASKRYEYLTWANKRNAIIIEDDFDSEFSLNKIPLETVFSMDDSDSVIYINTFSHSLAPSMRIGYMILPEKLISEYKNKLGFYLCSVPLFDQYVLAKFISRGYFERHINRVRRSMKRE